MIRKSWWQSLLTGPLCGFAPSPGMPPHSSSGGKGSDFSARALKVSPWLIALWWLTAAAVLPVTTDEAYYFQWASALDFGYFDHPPLVALMASTWKLVPFAGLPATLLARLGTVATAILTMILSLRLFKAAGLGDTRTRLAALLLSHANLIGLLYGFLTTPDVCLIFAWMLALHEALQALNGRPLRWLTAGLACGLGLEAKYTMLLMGPVFVWAMLRTPRAAGVPAPLRTPWPYLGGICALALWLPNLTWNANHDWITLHFQTRHGFSMERPSLPTKLPEALAPLPDSAEVKLAAAFTAITEATAAEEKAPGPFDNQLRALNRYVGFYGSQLALWGLMMPPCAMALWRTWRRRRHQAAAAHVASSPLGHGLKLSARPLLAAATLVPLIVFGFLSLGSKVEANWSAMYIFGAAAWLAPLMADKTRLLATLGAVHVALLSAVLTHAHTGVFAARPHKDRILLETHGYGSLAARLKQLDDAPVYADSYQIVAMSRYYAPELAVRQWPGITRPSEFLRREEWLGPDADELAKGGGLWLVTTDDIPPHLPGFIPTQMSLLRDCLGTPLQELDAKAASDVSRRCPRVVHEWQLIRYVPNTPGVLPETAAPAPEPAAAMPEIK